MSILDNATYLFEGTRVLWNSHTLPNVTSITGLGARTSSEIDTTGASSRAMEFRPGLIRHDTLQISGYASPQDVAMLALATSQGSGAMGALVAVLGGRGDGVHDTDGSGITVHTGLSLTAGGTGTADDPVTFTASGNAFDAVAIGDMVGYQETSDTTDQYTAITAMAVTSGNAVFTVGNLTSAVTLKANTTQSILRPAEKYSGRAGVINFSQNASTDGQWEYTVSLRPSGELAHTVGDPTVTLS